MGVCTQSGWCGSMGAGNPVAWRIQPPRTLSVPRSPFHMTALPWVPAPRERVESICSGAMLAAAAIGDRSRALLRRLVTPVPRTGSGLRLICTSGSCWLAQARVWCGSVHRRRLCLPSRAAEQSRALDAAAEVLLGQQQLPQQFWRRAGLGARLRRHRRSLVG